MADFSNISDKFLAEIQAIEQQLLKRIEIMLTSGASPAELAEIISEIDFFEELQSLGYESAVTNYFDNYPDILRDIMTQAQRLGVTNVTAITAQDLELIEQIQADVLLGRAELYGKQLKSRLIQGILTGMQTKDVVAGLTDIPLTDNQLTVAVNTGVNEFNRIATAEVYLGKPEQRFILAGPEDIRTRASCQSVLAYQPSEGWTKQQIDEGAVTKIVQQHASEFAKNLSELNNAVRTPYTFITAGGFNCRHDFIPIGD